MRSYIRNDDPLPPESPISKLEKSNPKNPTTMKLKTHRYFGSRHLRAFHPIRNTETPAVQRKRMIVSSVAAIGGLITLSTTNALAQTVYTIVPSATQLDWNTNASWTPTSGVGTTYPGSTALIPPDTTLVDTAIVSGAFGGVAQTVDLSAPLAGPLVAMTLGDTSGTGTTTIQSANASSLLLSTATITTAGTPGAVNVISAPITHTGNLTVGALLDASVPPVVLASNDLTISGKITPAAAASRTIINSSGKTLTLGDIDISTGSTASIVLTFRNENNLATNRINLHGVIANGGSVSASVIYDGRINGTFFELGNNTGIANTYTGATSLQSNGAGGRLATFLLNGDNLFGTGTLNLGQASNSTTVLQALNSPRTITNADVRPARNNTFEGTNSITFTGTITTGSSHIVTNNMTGSGQLIFDGRYNLDNSNQTSSPSDGRLRTFSGAGTTVFNGALADHAAPSADMFGGINVNGTGTVIINGTATYQGDTRITGGGTVQLGNGGTTGIISPDFPTLSYDDAIVIAGVQTISDPLTYPDFQKKSVVTGGTATATTGALAVKHSDNITLSSTINGPIGLKQIGSGVLIVDTPQFNTGASHVGDGIAPSKLVVTAGTVAETTQTGDFAQPQVHGSGYNNFYQIVTNLESTASLTIGQPVYISTPSGAIYIHSIDSATQVTLTGTGITNAGSGLIPGQNTTGPVVDQAIMFGAGSSLGSNVATTTVNNLGTLAGTGTISGAVTAVSGSHIAPGINTVDADSSGRFNFGVAGTLTTGALALNTGAKLDFDVAATAAGTHDSIVTANNSVTVNGANFVFNALTAGTLEAGTPYHLINAGTGTVTADTGLITTTLTGGLTGYTAVYSVSNVAGVNYLDVTFTVGGPTGYAGWAAANAPGQTAEQDHDLDGVRNGVEYFMGQTGSTFTPNPTAVSGTITWPKDPAYSGSYMIQTSGSLLANDWTDVPVNGTNPKDNGNSVEYTPPTGLDKLFVRLRVVPN
jgi:hypothetical protein